MDIEYIKIVKSLVSLVVYLVLREGIISLINKTMVNRLIQKSRGKIIKKGVNTILLLLLVALVLVIWGVKESDISVYIGSILTVVGVAFFAQWSILSNITSSIIIFFNHAVRLEDTIIIMEGKDYQIEGRVSDIDLFFVTLKTEDGEEIILPNNIFIQKTIRKKK